jgi:cellulose synthase/poly-beta-1,6-N-acetylglucosamine synthase-like glycosyltransferase
LTAIAAGLAGLALLLLVWSYLAYPAWIARLSRRRTAPGSGGHGAMPVSLDVVLSAADEEAVIGERIRNLLAQESAVPFRISLGCDGCGDGTAEEARRSLGPSGRVVEFPERRGKAAVVNDLIRESAADVVVFTDANTRFEPGAIQRLAEAFDDPDLGAVCGRLILEAGSSGAAAETAFWDRETRTKEAEGRLGVCLGANGAIYAARRAWIEPLPAGSAMDDFLIPARIARKGKKVVFAGEAVAREGTEGDAASEISRRFRIGAGAGQVLRQETWLFNLRRHGLLSFVFLSRKAARWIAPVLVLAAAAAALGDSRVRPAGAVLLAAAALLPLLALARPRLPRLPGLLGRLYYFGVINIALAAGVVLGLAGYRRPVWRRAR